MPGTGIQCAPSFAALAALQSALSHFRFTPQTRHAISRFSLRNASHQAQGRANKAAQGPGKRLGAKKTSGEYVVPGNILFKQRGTLWYPGENCYMGRDHTIHAGQPGFVRYYRDPAHPRRKFIGIVFEKDQNLPQPTFAVRRRKLGMLAYPMIEPKTSDTDLFTNEIGMDVTKVKLSPAKEKSSIQIASQPKARLRPGYQYRQGNWEIGRAADRAESVARSRGTTTRTFPDFQRGRGVREYRKKEVRRLKRSAVMTTGKAQKAKKKSR